MVSKTHPTTSVKTRSWLPETVFFSVDLTRNVIFTHALIAGVTYVAGTRTDKVILLGVLILRNGSVVRRGERVIECLDDL